MSIIEGQTSPRSNPVLITWRREQPQTARAAVPPRKHIAAVTGPSETPFLARRRRRSRRSFQ